MKSSSLRSHSSAEPPFTSSWDILRRAALSCEACPLYQNATQTVFGEGPRNTKIVLLGEQPGDAEDREGRPFVGPAGRLLNRALTQAGLDREKCYVTNAVKHFKWEPRGKRRLHQKPNSREIAACRPWWQAELKIHPATVSRVSRRNRGAGCLRARGQGPARTRQYRRDAVGEANPHHNPSFLAASSARSAR